MISVLSTTYCCESFYSVMKFVKSKHRVALTNQDLKELFRTATASYQPNFKQLQPKCRLIVSPRINKYYLFAFLYK